MHPNNPPARKLPSPAHRDRYSQQMLDWVIPKSDQYQFERYYILHWNPTYLFSTWGQYKPIIRENITYLTIYHNCHPNELKSAKVVLLSFRKLPDMKYGYVLITPARTLVQQQIVDHKSQLPKDRS